MSVSWSGSARAKQARALYLYCIFLLGFLCPELAFLVSLNPRALLPKTGLQLDKKLITTGLTMA